MDIYVSSLQFLQPKSYNRSNFVPRQITDPISPPAITEAVLILPVVAQFVQVDVRLFSTEVKGHRLSMSKH